VIREDVRLGENVIIYHPQLVNLYGCEIGDGCKIGAFVEIRDRVRIGRNVKIQAFAFIPEGVTVEDGVFIGPHVCFINDKHPRAVNPDGSLMESQDWELVPTIVRSRASIGANATIMCGITVGENAVVGAGALVSRDVAPNTVVCGVPARAIADVRG